MIGTNSTLSINEDGLWSYFHDTLLYLIMIFSIVGNLVFILSLLLRNGTMNILDKLMLHSVLCSSLLVIVSLPTYLVTRSAEDYPFGILGCKVLNPVSTYALNTGVFIYVVIAIERWLVVSAIQFDPPSRIKETLMFLMIHVCGIATVIPYVVSSTVTGNPLKCKEIWGLTAQRSYMVCLFVLQYGIPVPIMLICYVKAWQVIRQSQEYVASFSNEGVEFLQRTNRNSAVHRRYIQSRKILIKFTIIVLVFSLCMLPNQILWLIIDFYQKGDEFSEPILSDVSYLITYSNCVINPWLYGNFGNRFRANISRWLKTMKQSSCCNIFQFTSRKI